ncbi:MAG: hypothetical protein ACR2OZ_15040 [Verrucomicrobiales bacterium]
MPAETASWGREVIHFKVNPKTGKEERTGSTESSSDPAKNMLTQITRGANGVETMRREFIMDSKGRIRRGAIWDGQHQLRGRTEYGFDAYDRINEEWMFLANGRLIRRLLFKYDATGRRLPDKFYTWNPNDPFGPLIESKPRGDEGTPLLPVQKSDKELPGFGLPQFRGMEPPPARPVATPSSPPKRGKDGIFKKLFNRDKKPAR